MEVVDKVSLIEWLANNYKTFGKSKDSLISKYILLILPRIILPQIYLKQREEYGRDVLYSYSQKKFMKLVELLPMGNANHSFHHKLLNNACD